MKSISKDVIEYGMIMSSESYPLKISNWVKSQLVRKAAKE